MFSTPRMLSPLRIRDFALLWTGMTVSLVGDGILLVALAWQTYELSRSPSTLGWIAAAYVAPMSVVLLAGGVLTDRFERRKMMIAADLTRVVSLGGMGALAFAHELRLWELALLAAPTGIGDALFAPAFGAIVPEIVPPDQLVQANALDQFVRPVANVVGPALAGVLIAAAGVGTAFVVDAATFACSTLTALRLTPRPFAPVAGRSMLRELREGFTFVRERAWLWATLAAGGVAVVGPAARFVLLPHLVKNELHGSAAALGAVYATIAAGSILAALAYGQIGLTRRFVLAMYGGWVLALLVIAGYGVARNVAELAALGFVAGICIAYTQATWGTLLHRLVPRELLGRVTSFDWLVSTAPMPVWFVAVGFVADGAGVRPTLVGAGLVGAAVCAAFIAVPGVRDPERSSQGRR